MQICEPPPVSDIKPGDWVDRVLPSGMRPYARLARLDRPIGIWLLMFPCWWGTALASPTFPSPWFLILFALGATVMRAAGCVMNDIADRDFDARVARTANRPIASGVISVRQALAFMAALSLVGLLVVMRFNHFTVLLAAASLILVALYPFAKRVTDWPQAVLGLTFNWGALVGWSAVTGGLDLPALLLYAAGFFWTLGYDTIYAHQDKADDAVIGVRSTALRFGNRTRLWLTGFYSVATLLLAAAGGSAGGLGWPFAAGVVAVAVHFAWQTATLDIEDAKGCLDRFRANRHVGSIVFIAIVAGRLVNG
ncbi:4-hydroxybenzoate octaprenyltransferase [uncultured Defluviicoccus sp.]|uniref:4-hydroxybenzoate octaprenyltransferase n=1 Tax=metagenome TaxID=256318 RepID=A0A380TG25_9ZZZZ|nr:4-hydroxybenzoate octaprenyltransferase [uncultured Defluviicoccus sp.]